MDWKTRLKRTLERYAELRLYRHSLPRGVDFAYDCRRLLAPSEMSVVFDVGANVGQSAERFRLTYPSARIFCFEPVPTTYRALVGRVGSYPEVELHRIALGDLEEERYINIEPNPIGSGNSFVNTYASRSREPVRVRTLDNFCDERKIENIDLLKVDVEGFEIEVLKGAKKMLSEQRIKALYLETAVRCDRLHYFVPLHEIDAYIAPFGYSIFGIYDQEIDRIKNVEYLYFFNVAYVLSRLCERS